MSMNAGRPCGWPGLNVARGWAAPDWGRRVGNVFCLSYGQGRAVTGTIADSGQGLAQEECDRLFSPYYTTETYGTGPRLAIVQSVVSDH